VIIASAGPLIDSMRLMMPVTFIYERNASSECTCTESVRETHDCSEL